VLVERPAPACALAREPSGRARRCAARSKGSSLPCEPWCRTSGRAHAGASSPLARRCIARQDGMAGAPPPRARWPRPPRGTGRTAGRRASAASRSMRHAPRSEDPRKSVRRDWPVPGGARVASPNETTRDGSPARARVQASPQVEQLMQRREPRCISHYTQLRGQAHPGHALAMAQRPPGLCRADPMRPAPTPTFRACRSTQPIPAWQRGTVWRRASQGLPVAPGILAEAGRGAVGEASLARPRLRCQKPIERGGQFVGPGANRFGLQKADKIGPLMRDLGF